MFIWFVVVVFILAACGGLYLLSQIVQDKFPLKAVAVIHGVVAVTGICLLGYYTYYHRSFLTGLIVLCLAALGGLYIFSHGMLGKKIPKFLAVGHGATALIGIAILV